MADDLYLRNFRTTKPSNSSVPVTQFEPGDGIQFQWDSNGDTFKLYANGEDTLLFQGKTGDNTYSTKVPSTDTTYIIQASRQDTPVPLFATIHITLTPPQPLIASSIHNTGDDKVPGDLTAKDEALFKKNLQIEGYFSLFYYYQQLYYSGSKPPVSLPVSFKTPTDGFLIVYPMSGTKDNFTVTVDVEPSGTQFSISACGVKVDLLDCDRSHGVMTLPILKGQTFRVSSSDFIAATCSLRVYWAPMGGLNPTAATFSADWIEALEEAFQEKIGPELRQELLMKR